AAAAGYIPSFENSFQGVRKMRRFRNGPCRKLPKRAEQGPEDWRLPAEIVRLVGGLPFDVATRAGFLILVYRLVSQHSVESRPQVASGHWYSIRRPAVIQLTPVNQFPKAVKDKEVGGTSSRVTLGRLLRFVIEEWKPESKFLRHFLQARGAVI